MKKKKCEHLNFAANVAVNQITDGEGGKVEAFCADIHIECIDCHLPFQFIGLPLGVSFDKPMMEVDGLEARLPIAPQGEIPHPLGSKIRGFEIKRRMD